MTRTKAAWNLRTKKPWKTADITDAMVVTAYNDANRLGGAERNVFAYDILCGVLGCPEKVAYAAMERAADRGFIEYGVSLRTGWITPKGEALFAPPVEAEPAEAV